MFLVIILSLFVFKKSFDSAQQTSMAKLKKHLIIPTTLCILFGIGWGIGLAATQGITNVILLTLMQVIFILLTAFHGLYIFLMYGLRLKDARDIWKSWLNIILCNVFSTSDSKAGSLPRLREDARKKNSGFQVKIVADKTKGKDRDNGGNDKNPNKASGEKKV